MLQDQSIIIYYHFETFLKLNECVFNPALYKFKKEHSTTKMRVKKYNLSKIYNFTLFDPIWSNNVERSQKLLLSFLPYKISKASRVCESRL